jgi:hypothetical protein
MSSHPDAGLTKRTAGATEGESIPAEVRGLVAVLHTLPPWGRVVFLIALLAAFVAYHTGWV